MSPLLILLFSSFILLSPVISYTALDKLIYEDLEVVNEQGQGQDLEVVNKQGQAPAVTLDDLKYRLDLVPCSQAIYAEQSAITYKTSVYYRRRYRRYVCCAWPIRQRMQELKLDSNRQLEIKNNVYETNLIQHYQYACPNNGIGRIINVQTDIRPSVSVGGSDICEEYLSFSFNGANNNDCEFCGSNTFSDRTQTAFPSCLLTPINSGILVTYRTGYVKYNSNSYSGFTVTISCPTGSTSTNQEEKCIHYDTAMTSKEYFIKLRKLQDNSEMYPSTDKEMMPLLVPVDAKETLLQLYYEYNSNTAADRKMEVYELAVLSEKSCDEKLVSVAKQFIVAFFPNEAVLEARLAMENEDY